MKALVTGFGSIGQRHSRLLAPLVDQVAVVSSRTVTDYPVFSTLPEAIAAFSPDYIIISSITSAHGEQLALLKALNYRGIVLVEKPLLMHEGDNAAPYPFTAHVAYQLRFHPVIIALKRALQGRRPLSAHVYVGQHLSQWRPHRDVKTTYSARKAQGGGVLRDLSHELDLLSLLFGPIGDWHVIGGRVAEITVDSDDAVAFALRCDRCPVVSLQMNCLDHVPRREWIVNTPDASFKADLIKGTLAVNNDVETIPYAADDAYRAMHQAMLNKDAQGVCTFEEGLALVQLIDKVPLFN